ncbi:hypothetical protein [Limimaricola hongkongensis]|uniref:Uncharacterized protein n=1 Tax=Limimaricola hongkongensis DSM 17492 TaxID=1122180 RepID=A0A017HDD3_9RHOB|nr:hypothetical protein [Limimaricola hongkongensis]EYD71809.1 hypothetical protein Lokhon_01879 [Limimaricola hongkongensis DSM 17492]
MQDTSYTVKIEGFILGKFRKKGTTIDLLPSQATTFLREGRIVPKAAPKPQAKAKD